MSNGDVSYDVWVVANVSLGYRNRFDPVDHVLEHKMLPQHRRNIPRYPRVLWLVADVEKERAIVCKSSFDRDADLFYPREVPFPRHGIIVRIIANADVVWGR